MTYNFDDFFNRRDSDSVKWNRFDEDVLPLWVADTDFAAPPPIIDAIRARLDHGLFGYSSPLESTKKVICKWLDRRFDWLVSPEDILLFPGVVPAFNIATRACTNPGDSVLIQTPAYHPFLDLPSNLNIVNVEDSLQVNTKGNYEIDHNRLSSQLLPNTRIFMLCNPHNPTGRVFQENELLSIAKTCLDRNIIICSDEIHSDIIYSPHFHTPIASLSEDISQSTITLISPSKTFNLAGLKSSAVIITNPHLRERFINQSRGFTGSVNILGETAMSAAYSLCDEWLEELLNYLASNRQYLFDFVENELDGVSMCLPEGTYLGWLDFTDSALDSPAEFLLENARVALNAGDWFGSAYQKFARINFGCPSTTLLKALDRIRSALFST